MADTLPRAQLVELVRKIQAAEGTEEEIDRLVDLLEASVTHPRVTDLIFYPEGPELTAEEVVERALAYEPIQLGPSSDSA